jgi:hypothetical protein
MASGRRYLGAFPPVDDGKGAVIADILTEDPV